MSSADDDTPAAVVIASKWNARHVWSTATMPAPYAVVEQGRKWLPSIDNTPRVLDLACGRGACALWLAACGYDVHAWDISSRAIDTLNAHPGGAKITATVRDVIQNPPEANSFDAIVVSRFLDRSICDAISDALKTGGTLFYQTFTSGLSNPDYLLASNELLSLFDRLQLCWYHEPPAPDEHGKAMAMLVARNTVLHT